MYVCMYVCAVSVYVSTFVCSTYACFGVVAGAGGEKMRTSPVATLQGLVGAVGKIMNQMKFPVGSVNLTEFSTWLDDFVPAEHRYPIIYST